MLGPLTQTADAVVLLDPDGSPIGTADRMSVHGTDTPLHLAFSLYLFDGEHRLLLTRRALSKKTWPGVWTNTCCGHPRPDESFVEAIERRLDYELGMAAADLDAALPDFAYRAIDASGVVENEICPTYTGRVVGVSSSSIDQPDPGAGSASLHPQADPRPNPGEVMEWKWVPWNDVIEAVRRTPFIFSPWAVRQIRELSLVVA